MISGRNAWYFIGNLNSYDDNNNNNNNGDHYNTGSIRLIRLLTLPNQYISLELDAYLIF